MKTIVWSFGLLILCLLLLFKISEVNYVQGNVRLEVVVAAASLIFFFIGVYFSRPSRKTEMPPVVSLTPPSAIDYEQIKKVGLTQREHDVLVKIAEGFSNQEIAQQLFLSESTIKTHVSNILFKLEAKRRTQAVQIAKQLKIVA